jgi:serine/threonine protein kinase
MLELEGITLSHYHLHHSLGRGGMSEVYLATDQRSQQEVAIKLVNSSHMEYSERFQREVKTISALTHRHILPAFDHGQHSSWHYLVMPYMKQGTLRERLAKRPLTLEEAGEVFEQAVDALQFAHDHGIIHRDIKPSNILLRDEHYVYLADFGLAKALWAEGENEITQTGYVIGTPEYMAPELVEQPADISSDIYALGILLYEMLTGRTPFKGSTPIATCWKQLREQPTRPSILNPAIPRPVERVILRALEKDPQCRFPSARELLQAYKRSLRAAEQPETILVSLATSDHVDTPPLHAVTPQRANGIFSSRKLIAVPAILLLLLSLSLSLGFYAASTTVQKTPAAWGANVSLLGEKDTQHKHIITPTPQSSPGANSSGNTQNHGHGGGHGHKHKHGHGHGHGDDGGDTSD